ncbi:AMP-binding protein, partial [Candidatus Poribacteria bacterium]|nr:AMP-binding protein [Candidatus Poribacteria bacterium]
PTIFRHFVNTLTGDEKFPHLRIIDICSEPVHQRDVELYKKHFSHDCIFLNRLGATELNVIRMYFLDRNTELYSNVVPVGYGLEDTELLLLDEGGKNVGFNNPGEMVIKSRYLSPGYWERPDLNMDKFKSDPEDENIRMYYTGDLGFMLPDGCLFHLGRKDFQVKIRGYRVETAEIEMSLLRHEDIQEAVVAARQDQYGDQYLVAFIVIKEGKKSPTITEMREFLEQTLPDYMIPAVFMTLDDIPLTPNGKIDWQALPETKLDRPELNTPFKPPGTPIEAKLTDIWSLVLGISEVGIQDDFFDLGGHSLLATQVVSRVEQNFGIKIKLDTIFQSPTIEEIALIIDQKKIEKPGKENLDKLLDDIESMSDEDIKRKLQEE